jgi:hypothetical protein
MQLLSFTLEHEQTSASSLGERSAGMCKRKRVVSLAISSALTQLQAGTEAHDEM